MPSKTRVSLSQVLLTYPQCPKSVDDLISWLKGLDGYECCVACHEPHETTEGDHLHAWVKFQKKRVIASSTLQKMFDWEGYHPNIQLVKRSPKDKADTVKYIMKHGDWRADNCNVKEIVKGGTTKSHERKYNNEKIINNDLNDLVEKNEIPIKDLPALQRAKDMYLQSKPPQHTLKPKGIWIWGDAGIGKTKWCEQFGEYCGGYFEKMCNKWFDGYEDQKVIIMDEVRDDKLIKSGYIFKWADNSPCKGEVKQSTRWLRHKYILITSNDNPMDFCRGEDGCVKDSLWEPLQRRFKIMHITKDMLPQDKPYLQFDSSAVYDNPWCSLKEVLQGYLDPKEEKIVEEPPPVEMSIEDIEESLPKEPSLEEPQTKKVPPPPDSGCHTATLSESQKDIIFENCMKIINHQPSSEEIEKLPRLASEEEAPSPAPQKQSSETELDDLDLMSTSEHIDWSAMRAECHDDPEEEVTDAIPEGDESDPEEEEPSASSLDFSSSLD